MPINSAYQNKKKNIFLAADPIVKWIGCGQATLLSPSPSQQPTPWARLFQTPAQVMERYTQPFPCRSCLSVEKRYVIQDGKNDLVCSLATLFPVFDLNRKCCSSPPSQIVGSVSIQMLTTTCFIIFPMDFRHNDGLKWQVRHFPSE